MKSKDLIRRSARLAHLRNQTLVEKKALRGMPADITHSLHLATVQLSHAIDELDRLAGEQARRELKG